MHYYVDRRLRSSSEPWEEYSVVYDLNKSATFRQLLDKYGKQYGMWEYRIRSKDSPIRNLVERQSEGETFDYGLS